MMDKNDYISPGCVITLTIITILTIVGAISLVI